MASMVCLISCNNGLLFIKSPTNEQALTFSALSKIPGKLSWIGFRMCENSVSQSKFGSGWTMFLCPISTVFTWHASTSLSVCTLQGRAHWRGVPRGDRQEGRQVQGATLPKVDQGAPGANGGARQETRRAQVCMSKKLWNRLRESPAEANLESSIRDSQFWGIDTRSHMALTKPSSYLCF